MKLVVNSPGELVAAIPHVLGFRPTDSLVVVPLTEGLPVARLDIPEPGCSLEGFCDTLVGPYARNARTESTVAIVCFTDDAVHASSISSELAQRFEFVGITTKLRLSTSADQWKDLETGIGGTLSEGAALRLASEAVMAGVPQPVATRAVLAASLVGDRTPLLDCLPAARQAAQASTPTIEQIWAARRCKQFEVDGIALSDPDGARILLALDNTSTRDALWEATTIHNASAHVALWSDLVRRAPEEVRAAPAALCGFSSWLKGDGARAWCALDEVPAGRPYPLAAIVATLLQEGVNPREWAGVRSFMTEFTSELDESIVPDQEVLEHRQSAAERQQLGIAQAPHQRPPGQ
jgi:hypothetical protein